MTNNSPDIIGGTRFSGGEARGFLSSMGVDQRIFDADVSIDFAHVIMLAEEDIISTDEASLIIKSLLSIRELGFENLPTAEDIHAAIETAVISNIGDTGGKMHTARSRNDEVSTCIRYRLRSDILEAISAVIDLRTALLTCSKLHIKTIMPGFTHLQFAQPSTLSHWMLSYSSSLERDTDRLFDAYKRTNLSPLGSAAFAGTPFPINRKRTSTLLGFENLIENTMDAVSSRDFLIECSGVLCSLSLTLSNLSADLIFYSNKKFVEISDEFASTSSIMPQKKNPDTLELIRAASAMTLSTFSGIFTTLKGLPRAYNRDLQAATPYIWNSIDRVTESTNLFSKIIQTSAWDIELLSESSGEGFSTATGVADVLTMAGVPFRKAHQIVAQSENNHDSISSNFKYILGSDLSDFCTKKEIESALNPTENVEMRGSLGGPSSSAIKKSLHSSNQTLQKDKNTYEEILNKVLKSKKELEQEITNYL